MMGEAKRKRQTQEGVARGDTIQVIDLVTNEPRTVRQAPSVDELLHIQREAVQRDWQGDHSAAVKVPCAGCTACCRQTEDIPVEAGEDGTGLSLTPADAKGRRYLLHNPDGDCVHLTPSGCGVYAHRPYACRVFDCRLSSAFGIGAADRPEHPMPIWATTGETPEERGLNGFALTLGLLAVKREVDAGKDWSIGELLPGLIVSFIQMRPKLVELLQALVALPPAAREEAAKAFAAMSPVDNMRQLAASLSRSK